MNGFHIVKDENVPVDVGFIRIPSTDENEEPKWMKIKNFKIVYKKEEEND